MVSLTKEIDEEYVKAMLKERQDRKPKERWRALVMVLGDIGHSPRMQYHVASLAKTGFDVDFLGYYHSDPRAEILHKKTIDIHPIRDVPKLLRKFPKIIYFPVRIIWSILTLLHAMYRLKRPDVVLIQNPPTIPIVFCAFLINYFWQAAIILDWHNYSYSILAINMKRGGLLRRILLMIMEYCEKCAAVFSDANFSVTKAMVEDMKRRWDARSVTLYDRPPEDFGPSKSMEALHFLFMKLGGFSSAFRADSGLSSFETAFTVKEPGEKAMWKQNRPALIVSSTSWTEDEDFGLLFDALKLYDAKISADGDSKLPKIVAVVTGKGPLKEFYMKQIQKENLRNVSVASFWLETADYPRLLGCADLGISLHYSSSGLDLPMKVVDMFGCGLPVCAVKYNCIEELVRPRINGLLFSTPQELCDQFCVLLKGFPDVENPLLRQLSENAQTFRNLTWHSNWGKICHPVINSAIESRKKTKVDVKKRITVLCVVVAVMAIILKMTMNLVSDFF